ncbi:hypothetical protein [Paenibacillus gansuensis]|uniref:Uncharacterized protein n=1 Tax=Paenibacillus gansuensis TaxID=306542 RepID=A0ABW5PIS4_9BACL
MFAAGFAACFEGAMGTVMRQKGIKSAGSNMNKKLRSETNANKSFQYYF